MNPSAPDSLPYPPGSPDGDAPVRWRLLILAAGEPRLLPRVVQKITVPEIELRSVQFEAGGSGHAAQLELVFSARADRARLAAVRMRKIIGMEQVTLRAADRTG